MKEFLHKQKLLFVKSLQTRQGYSPLTAKTYFESIHEALTFLEAEQEDGQIKLNLMPYRVHIAKLNTKTISKKLSAIRSFVQFLNENGHNVLLDAQESVKVSKTLPKPIAHSFIVEALSLCNEEEKLLVVLLYTLGLRISELSNLKLSNISKEWLRVDGKGSKQRDVPLLSGAKILLDAYIEEMQPQNYLFEKKKVQLNENALRYKVKKVFKKIGMHVSPHQLRHSFATELLNSGAPIVDVSELLGHSSMATTQIYTQLSSALKQDNYKKAHPLSGK